MSKDAIIRLLLRIYPRAWRLEYGEELSAILAGRPFTPLILGDVVVSGAWQRFRYAEMWQVGGVALALRLIIGTAANSLSPLSPAAYHHFFQINWIAELAIGYLYVARYSRHPVAAAVASVKASLVGLIPELLLAALWAANLIHPTILGMNGSPHIYGHSITDLCLRTEAAASPATLLMAIPVTVISAFLAGFAGASIATGVSLARRRSGAHQ
ncbi:hypothetical protein [Terracidiphilus sp.]|jgi:hypothetical protein|uniref:hypothetical protein n=1 Tax=Terracidiphilus sp. TaxID=1964191 RepID=UPI003C232993